MLPQLNLYWFAGQFFWTFLFFGVTVLVSYYLFVPRVKSSISNRDGFLSDLQTEINRLSVQVDGLEKSIEDKRNALSNEFELNLTNLYADYDRKFSKAKIEIEKSYIKKLEDHKLNLEHWRDKFLDDVKSRVHELAEKLRNKLCQ
ncbi:MAG: hypothetical protein H6845_01145 [Alphaproteobacteria bacterium]|nr:MAG: hypothetical protein H6845_01145 [Alphaproteobacteria bacterium]